MKILLYGYNYYPELTGIGKYTTDLAEWLQDNQCDVTVITGMPYYPDWKIHKEYVGKIFIHEKINNVNVYRSYLKIPKKVTSRGRLLLEISFLITSFFSFLKVKFVKKHFDIVISISPPFYACIYSLILFKKSYKINHIQDLQIDAADKLEILKNNNILRLFYRLEKRILNKMDLISTISEGMKEKIKQRGIYQEVDILPNWVDIDYLSKTSQTEDYRLKWGYNSDDIIFLYSGNLGEKQGLENIILIAKEILDPKIKFVIVGNGAAKERLLKMKNESQLKNIRFFDLQPYENLSSLLRMADYHLIIEKSDASDIVLPSKLTSILAIGGISIITANENTTLYNLVKDHNIGVICNPDDYKILKDTIEKVSVNSNYLIGQNSIEYASKMLDKNKVLGKFLKKISS